MRISRRDFVKNSALCAGGIKLIPLFDSNYASAQSAVRATAESLEQQFLSPAEDVWPWVYWYGDDGNISREAITADLESMRRVGIRGALYMEVDEFLPKGPVRFLTPEWRDLMKHAMSEATRLGMDLNFDNDGGWCGSALDHPGTLHANRRMERDNGRRSEDCEYCPCSPKTVRDYYNDIVVLAFPEPPGDSKRMVDHSPSLTYGTDRKEFDFSKVLDGNPGTLTLLPVPAVGQPFYLNIDFPEPFTAQAVSIALDAWSNGMILVYGAVQVSDDGKNYRTIREMSLYWPNSSVNFPKVSARHYRVLIKPDLAGDFFWKQYTKGIPLGEVQLHVDPRIEDIPGKAMYLRQGAYSTENNTLSGQPKFPEDAVIRNEQILDLSNKIDSSGLLKWDVPPGRWTVLRIGHTSTGKENHPAPQESMGLECDKLSKTAIEVQFEGLIGKLLQDQAEIGAKALKMTHIDSWETGGQNWTTDFREQFQNRRGYDPLAYLPILTGRAIESAERSERFLWDLRRTVADLLLDNYADHLKELCQKRGLTLSIEAYGAGPLDELRLWRAS